MLMVQVQTDHRLCDHLRNGVRIVRHAQARRECGVERIIRRLQGVDHRPACGDPVAGALHAVQPCGHRIRETHGVVQIVVRADAATAEIGFEAFSHVGPPGVGLAPAVAARGVLAVAIALLEREDAPAGVRLQPQRPDRPQPQDQLAVRADAAHPVRRPARQVQLPARHAGGTQLLPFRQLPAGVLPAALPVERESRDRSVADRHVADAAVPGPIVHIDPVREPVPAINRRRLGNPRTVRLRGGSGRQVPG